MKQYLFELLDQAPAPRIAVLGDIMLDRYTWGDAERVSPEAPVLVLRAENEEVRLGGAASVAYLLRALGAQVRLLGVIGDDTSGRVVRKLVEDAGIDTDSLVCAPVRPTTTKERFLGRAVSHPAAQLLRVDREISDPVDVQIQNRLLASLLNWLPDCQALLISDYAKGVCTPELLAKIIASASMQGIPVLVDPARLDDYERYRHATVLMPNRREAETATCLCINSFHYALQAGQYLCEEYDVDVVLVKLDRDGMVLVQRNTEGLEFTTRPRSVCDVTGAGDMVLATVGYCKACGLNWAETIQLATIAAGLEVESVGVVPVSWAEIRSEFLRCKETSSGKVVTLQQMTVLAEVCRNKHQRIVFTNGCFDLLHIGHVTYLQEAAKLGDVLVVAVNSDQSVRGLKGSSRPIIGEVERLKMLAALACVDYVLLFDEQTPHELLRRLQPEVLVKGGNYAADEVVGREFVESYGGQVQVIGWTEGVSTTTLIARVHERTANLIRMANGVINCH